MRGVPRPDATPRIFFAADRKLKGFDGDRDEFIGSYRSESNPYAIEHGGCTNSTLKGGDPCGALELELTLAPGEEMETNISFYATGTFRGVGFRDTAQDAIAHASVNICETKEKLRLLFSQQYKDGHANHYFFPEEGSPPVTRLHSDNHIWPILAMHQLVVEEGSLDFLNETIRFYDAGEASAYEHLKQSIAFTRNNMGSNGFPLMLTSDWNDMLYKVCREGKGESIWMAMFLGYALPKLAELARLLGDGTYADELDAFWCELKETVETKAWDGKWYRRAIMDNGEYLGTESMDEAKIWLNPQSWSVLSGMVDAERARTAMDSVSEILDTPLGIKKIYPPIVNYPSPEDPLSHYYPGCGENGSVFCHANTWAIIAECMLGRGDKAWEYYRKLIPHNAMREAGSWRYKAEPHVYASNIFGPESDKFGLANVSWLTGTAAWMMIAANQHILGIRPTWNGLCIDPCLPQDWEAVRVTRRFRGTEYRITIRKQKGPHGRTQELVVDGDRIYGAIIPPVAGRAMVQVEVNLPPSEC